MGWPLAKISTGVLSSTLADLLDHDFKSDIASSMAKNVTISRKEFVMELSLFTSACWVVSLMISSSTKSKVVICARERLPLMRKTSQMKAYVRSARSTESMEASFVVRDK